MSGKITVLCRSAYSIVKVSKHIAEALGANIILGKYNPFRIDGYVIIVGNPDPYFERIAYVHRHNKQIWYLTMEGLITNFSVVELAKKLKPYIIANSRYTREKLEQIGLWVDEIIPHGIKTIDIGGAEKNIEYLYVAGYMKRKYPPYSEPVIKHVSSKAVFVTTHNNPYLKYMKRENVYWSAYDIVKDNRTIDTDEKLAHLYASAKFYLNLSDVEGFGLTPLEALGYGATPIVLNISPFTDYCTSECCIFYPWNSRIWYELFGTHIIEHYAYDPETVIEVINKAKYDPVKANMCKNIVRAKYDYKKIYRRFLYYIK